MFKRRSVSRTHLSPHTYTACVVWCGIGHEELMLLTGVTHLFMGWISDFVITRENVQFLITFCILDSFINVKLSNLVNVTQWYKHQSVIGVE